MKKHKKHVVLEELLASIRNDWDDVACENAERIFNIQEGDIDKLFRSNEILKAEYESILRDYERLDDNPSVDVYGKTYDAVAIAVLLEQIAAAGRQIDADVDELEEKDDMINAMIEGFNLRWWLAFDTYDVDGYDWSLVVNRIKMSEEPDEVVYRIEQIEKELEELKNILAERK